MLQITYYTDPLCCWSWAMEPAWQRLLSELEGRVEWRYCMGGLLKDWKNYHDEEQHVSRPIQMGPVWLEAKYLSGQPLNEKIWLADPPASSYPACIAVKCAALQSREAEHAYLHALRKAVMTECKNIAKKEVLLEVSEKTAAGGLLDAAQFRSDLDALKGLEAFRGDLLETGFREIRRFPTMIFQSAGGGVIVKGYRPYEKLAEVADKMLAGAVSDI